MPRVLIISATLVLALLAGAAPSPALAAGGPCTPAAGSPHCTYWNARVTFIADGDTIDVRVAGHPHRKVPVRITGINAMELSRYSKYPDRRRGACHAVAATNRLEQLLRRGHLRVRLAAQHASSRSGHRPRRQVSVRIGGHWVDVAQRLMAEGHALFLSNPDEWAWNREYETLAQRAAARQLHLWNPRGCGAGPAAPVRPAVHVNHDAPGDDFQNVNGEYARISNPSSRRLSLSRWWFRDSALRRFTFPHGAVVPAHGSVVLHVGRGPNGGGVFHWGLAAPVFETPSFDERGIGDGGYLFDPRGSLRAWDMYPCLVSCG